MNFLKNLQKLFHKKNLFLGLSVLIKFTAIGVAVLIARWQNVYLDPQSLRDFNLTIAYLAIILGIVNFGVPQILYKLYTNETDQTKLNDIWSTFLVIRLFTFLVGVLVILVTFKLSRVDNLLLILGVFTAQFILLADQSFRSVVDSRDLSQRFSLTDLIGKLLLTASLYIGVWLHLGNNQNLALYILASILIYLGVYFLDQVINHKFTHFTGFKLHILKENLKSLIYLALPGFIFVGSLDQIFLEYFGTDKFTFNGYANASKIFQTAAILPALIVPVIASRLKIKIKTFTSEQIKANSSRYLIYLGSIGFIYCGLIYLFSPLIFKILDPKDLYSRYSLVVMPWFCLALFTQFINFFYYNLNIFIHREKLESVYYYIYSICLLFSIFVCLKLFGYIGGGIAFAFISYLDLIVRLSLLRPILSNENQ